MGDELVDDILAEWKSIAFATTRRIQQTMRSGTNA